MISFLKRIFKISNKIRLVLINLIFWLALIAFILLVSNEKNKSNGKVLFLKPEGIITELGREEQILSYLISQGSEESNNSLISNLLDAINKAKNDKKISSMLLDLDSLSYAGYGVLEELGKELQKFKDSGKPIYAYSKFYNQQQYYLASFASEIIMDPYGNIEVNGLASYRNYWKDALDKYNVSVNVFRAGEFKSYVEPYLSNSMSIGVKEQNLKWMTAIWDDYINQISNNRNLDKNILDTYLNNRINLVRKYNGDSALLALGAGFIDRFNTESEVFNEFTDLYNYTDYLNDNNSKVGNTKIGIITLEGTITYSNNSTGSISAVKVDELLDMAINQNMDGVIIRINSGGGGVFASEVIRRKVELLSKHIPVVISMGDVCASGGYWISTAGNYIFADSGTITGSIGVFGMVLGFENTLEDKFGIISDGVSTTPYADTPSLTRNISDEAAEIYQLNVENTYSKFLNLVSKSRNISLEELDSIAGGRVWSGGQALGLGLVDSIGGLHDAKDYMLKELKSNNFEFIYLESERPFFELILNEVVNLVQLKSIKIIEELNIFQKIDDPKSIYALWK